MSEFTLPIPEPSNVWGRRLVAKLKQIFSRMSPPAGWKDLTADLTAAKVGGGANTAPTWVAINSTGVYGWNFPAAGTTELWVNFHMPHDIAYTFLREDRDLQAMTLYPHIHWLPDGTDTGTVRFGFEYIYAKGYGDGVFGSSTTIYLEQASDGTAWTHNIVETTDDNALVSADFETDGLMLVRIFRDGGHANDTLTDDVIIPFVDLHYYSDGKNTAERNRNSSSNIPWTKIETL